MIKDLTLQKREEFSSGAGEDRGGGGGEGGVVLKVWLFAALLNFEVKLILKRSKLQNTPSNSQGNSVRLSVDSCQWLHFHAIFFFFLLNRMSTQFNGLFKPISPYFAHFVQQECDCCLNQLVFFVFLPCNFCQLKLHLLTPPQPPPPPFLSLPLFLCRSPIMLDKKRLSRRIFKVHFKSP